MPDDILCPDCHHPLGFHPYYERDATCSAPLGGIFNHIQCGCRMTLQDFIKNLQDQDVGKEFEALQKEHQIYADELQEKQRMYLSELLKYQGITRRDAARIRLLEEALSNVKEILVRGKILQEARPVYARIVKTYKDEIHKIIDEALVELEKTDGTDNNRTEII